MTINELKEKGHDRIVDRIKNYFGTMGRPLNYSTDLVVSDFDCSQERSEFWGKVLSADFEEFYNRYPAGAVFPADGPAYPSKEEPDRPSFAREISDDEGTPPAKTFPKKKPVPPRVPDFTTQDNMPGYFGRDYHYTYWQAAKKKWYDVGRVFVYEGHSALTDPTYSKVFHTSTNATKFVYDNIAPDDNEYPRQDFTTHAEIAQVQQEMKNSLPSAKPSPSLDDRQKQLAPHYDNSKGSLYKVATERNWNAYLFDVVKRLERGGKKDPLETEIRKSIVVLELWLREMCDGKP